MKAALAHKPMTLTQISAMAIKQTVLRQAWLPHTLSQSLPDWGSASYAASVYFDVGVSCRASNPHNQLFCIYACKHNQALLLEMQKVEALLIKYSRGYDDGRIPGSGKMADKDYQRPAMHIATPTHAPKIVLKGSPGLPPNLGAEHFSRSSAPSR